MSRSESLLKTDTARGSNLNVGVYAVTFIVLMFCMFYWINFHSNGVVLFFLLVPAMLVAAALPIPTLFLPTKSSWLVAAATIALVNIVGINGEEIDRRVVRNSKAAAVERLADQMASFIPTHYVSDNFATIQFRPKTSTSPGLDRLPFGRCVQLIDSLVNNGFYSSVIIPDVDGVRYIYGPRLTRLNVGQSCDIGNNITR